MCQVKVKQVGLGTMIASNPGCGRIAPEHAGQSGWQILEILL